MSPTLGREDPPGARAVDAQNPWPGLAAFTEEQQAYFFGRDEEAGEVLRRVKRKTLTVLFGMSGLGKTSVLQAGVFPRLRRDGYLPVYVRLDYQDGAPDLSAQIKTELARTLEAADLMDPVLPSADETLWEYFHRRDSILVGRDGQPRSLVRAFPRRDQRPRREPSPARARGATGHAIRADRSPRLRQAGLPDPVQPPRGLPASARRSARAHALHHGESAAADPDDRSPGHGGGNRAGARPRASRRGTADRALRRPGRHRPPRLVCLCPRRSGRARGRAPDSQPG